MAFLKFVLMEKMVVIVDGSNLSVSCEDRIKALIKENNAEISLVFLFEPVAFEASSRMLMKVDNVLNTKAHAEAASMAKRLNISDVVILYPKELESFIVKNDFQMVIDCQMRPLSDNYYSETISVKYMK